MARMVVYNGVEYSPESDVGKEALKFEQPNYRPELHPYPRMLYRAFKCEDGIVRADAGAPPRRSLYGSEDAYREALARDDEFNNRCRVIVGQKPMSREQAEAEHRKYKEMGWYDNADEAVEAVKNFETLIKGAAAAERAHRDRGMSEKAKEEVAKIEASTPDILPEIPEQPRVRKVSEAPKKEHWKTREARLRREAASAA